MHDEAREPIDAAGAAGLPAQPRHVEIGVVARAQLGRATVLAHGQTSEQTQREARRLPAVFARFGFQEDYAAAAATGNTQLRFVRTCRHVEADGAPAHDDDHVDVFLDTFRMDHEIELAGRLDSDRYTVSVSDLLLTKLQIIRVNEKDIRDIVTLLDGVTVSDTDAVGAIEAGYIAGLCANDWSLFHDVGLTLQRVAERVEGFGLSANQVAAVQQDLARLVAALTEMPKRVRFRLRACLGTRAQWHNEIDEQG